MITQEYLKSILRYEPETGLWFWVKSPNRRIRIGAQAGSLDSKGYIRIGIEGVDYRAHRLSWLYMTGELPTFEIDHEDRVRTNNRWKNLRPATRSQQLANTSLVDKGLPRGVSWNVKLEKYQARIQVDSKQIWLGLFDDLEQASAIYRKAAIKYFGEYANGV